MALLLIVNCAMLKTPLTGSSTGFFVRIIFDEIASATADNRLNLLFYLCGDIRCLQHETKFLDGF